MKQLIICTLINLLFSCSIYKEKRADTFFNKWDHDSKIIYNAELKNVFEENIYQLSNLALCPEYYLEQKMNRKSEYPKLKYFIVQDKIIIKTVKHFSKDFNPIHIIKTDTLQNRVSCSNVYFPLILTEKYKRKIGGKLRYGFGTCSSSRNKDNARAFLSCHYSSNYYKIPLHLGVIEINTAMDSAIIKTSDTYSWESILYIKSDNGWEADKQISYSKE